MPSSYLILCCCLLLLPLIFLNIRVFSNESALHIRWPKYWSFSFNISPSNEYSGLISFRMDCLDLLAVQESFPTSQFKNINSLVLSLLYGPTLTSIHDYWKKYSFEYMKLGQHFHFTETIETIRRHLLLGRKVITNLDSLLKSRDITLPTKIHQVVMYGCESWTVKKAEC